MWSTFIFSIAEKYEAQNYLFGGGFGVYEDLFVYGDSKLKMWFKQDYIPTPHNQFLSTFVSGGITLLIFYGSLFVWANRVIKYNGKMLYSFLILLVVLVFTSGITMPLFDKFITWVSLAFISLAIYLKNIRLSAYQ